MTKEFLSYLSLFIALFVGALYYSDTVHTPLTSTLNAIKSSYHDSIAWVVDGYERHFFQASQIDELKAQLKDYEKSRLLIKQYQIELAALKTMHGSDLNTSPDIELVRALSYQQHGNFNKVWLEMSDFNASRLYGLTYKEYVAGIVSAYEDKPLALLNQEIKSSYAVTVGTTEAPGIAHGNNDENLVVKFIPSWYEINEGDEVVTSGLDHIFFKGLKVGKVLSSSKSEGYQTAIAKPYYNPNRTDFFYVIKEVK